MAASGPPDAATTRDGLGDTLAVGAREVDAGDAAGDAGARDAWDAAEVLQRDGDVDAGDADVVAADAADGEATDVGGDAAPPARWLDPETVPVDVVVFDLGVQAGDVTPDGALLWTRALTVDPVRVVVLDDRRDGPGRVLVDEAVEVADGGFVHVAVSGLPAHTRHRYFFVRVGADGTWKGRSVVGHFLTAPAPGALVPLVFGLTSCTKQSWRPYETLRRAAEDALDLFVLAGDTAYNDGARTLAEYRASWYDSLTDVGYRELLAATSIVATWDDHEIDNNWNPETIDPEQLAAGTQAFFETLAIRRDPAHPNRVWRKVSWGATADFFVLDCRSERLPSTRHTPEAQYLSPEQLAWLEDGLASSKAVFKFVVNSVPITDMPPALFIEGDRWEGYDAQRNPLVDFVASIPNVYWLSGDFHFPALAHVDPEGPGWAQFEIISGPGANLPNPLWWVVTNGLRKAQFPFAAGVQNYVRITADPLADPPVLVVEFVDADGDILHATTLTQ